METESPQPTARPAKRDPYRLVGEILLERYRLDDYAGGGAMGAVYRSWDLANDRLIAVKILKPDLMEKEPSYATLFQREVDAARVLNHPHIVRVFDNGNTEDVSFMAMEWLDGQTLQEVVDENPLNLDRVRTVFEQICRASIRNGRCPHGTRRGQAVNREYAYVLSTVNPNKTESPGSEHQGSQLL